MAGFAQRNPVVAVFSSDRIVMLKNSRSLFPSYIRGIILPVCAFLTISVSAEVPVIVKALAALLPISLASAAEYPHGQR